MLQPECNFPQLRAEQRNCLNNEPFINLPQSERTQASDHLINTLSDVPAIGADGVERAGIRTRLQRLFANLAETNDNNSVALWTRYYWQSQIEKLLAGEPYFPTA